MPSLGGSRARTQTGWLVGLALAAACNIEPRDLTAFATSSSGDPAPARSARVLFDALEPHLVDTCGGCHETVTAPFLALPDRYRTLVEWPGIVALDLEQSVLLTHPLLGTGHQGANLDAPDLAQTLAPLLREWLARELEERAAPHPATGPFEVTLDMNDVDLSGIAAGLEGMSLTFLAGEIGATSLKISSLHAHAAGRAVRVVHPLFAVVDDQGRIHPDPADSLSGIDQTFQPGESGELPPGTLILTNWQSGARLVVGFEVLEAL